MYLAADSTSSLLDVFLQYGAIGAMLVVLGYFARTLIKREQDRSDRLEAENQRLNTITQEKTVPALLEATNALAKTQETLDRIEQERRIEREYWERRQRRPGEGPN